MNGLEEVGLPGWLDMVAEEATELAHAALKYSRKLRGENPTPATMREVQRNFLEEIADVTLAIDEMLDSPGYFLTHEEVSAIKGMKRARMIKRLLENKRKGEQE